MLEIFTVGKDAAWSLWQAAVGEVHRGPYGFGNRTMLFAFYSPFEKQLPACSWALTTGHRLAKTSELLIMSWALYYSCYKSRQSPVAVDSKTEAATSRIGRWQGWAGAQVSRTNRLAAHASSPDLQGTPLLHRKLP